MSCYFGGVAGDTAGGGSVKALSVLCTNVYCMATSHSDFCHCSSAFHARWLCNFLACSDAIRASNRALCKCCSGQIDIHVQSLC